MVAAAAVVVVVVVVTALRYRNTKFLGMLGPKFIWLWLFYTSVVSQLVNDTVNVFPN